METKKNPLSPHLQIYRWHISSLLSITHRIVGVINILAISLICFGIIYINVRELNYENIQFYLQTTLIAYKKNMINKNCKNCKSNNFKKIFSLGNLSFSGRFGKTINENIPKEILNLIICKKCKLVQLDRSFNPKYLYGESYGYRTGINKTMTDHVKKTVLTALKIKRLKKK